MSIKAIDPVGVTVEYLGGIRWSIDASDQTIHIYGEREVIAIVPGDWIVSVLPHIEVDPGVEARE